MDWSKFDNQIDAEQMKKDVEEAKKNGGNDFPEIPKGTYVVTLKSMELGETKTNPRPMLKAQFKISEGEFKGQHIFYNRVMLGTKNDASMIASAVSFVESLEPSADIGAIVFNSFADFADLVLDVAEDVADLEYEVEYDPSNFNSIKVTDVFDN